MQRADIIIHNNGSLEHLKEQVEWVMKRFDGSSTL
jgi:dephospho-CoA kinase